ncbi:TPA: hypothetical protein SHW33_003795 [Clostridioides difficile]|uniref:rhodanese-related sulfurtransferase n=1 Tax=Clostridium phage phiCD6356 TaxID=864178 RepID=UPI0001DE02A8|nr:hypothetical protein [Clostridioides difficile]YP_004306127.1 rhodanese-related sulfurtransferase [Clostridium phage phiCD6356]ADK37888.1 hypothetical protein phiCD6356_26 [Clostridium phage phiCD6356]EGT4856698.1 hypothetical protein [Clostridioides difficile]EGT5248049.1 hypothetical protein [Clostridioides difficile]EGT5284684.1 hypothetical protein [Clostridioides difficile]EJX3466007.1 hypothetical protein [Clostridioides difficile]
MNDYIEVGRRIFFDEEGEIIFYEGQSKGNVPERKNIKKIEYIDLEYDYVDYDKYKIIGINIETKQPILEEIPIYMSEEEKRIQELENQLLIAENEKVGGLL